MILFLIIFGFISAYLLFYKPDIFAVIFFTITIANINFSLGGLPLNIRALLGMALLARTFIPDKSFELPSFFSTNAKYIFLFILYTIIISEVNDLLTFEFIKSCALTLISAYLGCYYFFKKKSAQYIKLSLILAGLICFSDLVYTYVFVGSFPVQRIYQRLLNIPLVINERGDIIELVNWNFYGMICGTAFIMILNDYINGHVKNKLIMILLPVMFLGVLMSTSRSTLMGLIFASVFLIGREIRKGKETKRAYTLISVAITLMVLSLFVFITLKDYITLDSDFIDRITERLIDEPIAVFNKQLGLAYNAQSLDAMDWRQEASADAFAAFLDLRFLEQFFGIGFWGYATRDLGHNNLPPHNGFLMLLIEYGIVGFVFFVTFVGSVITKSLRSHSYMPSLVTALLFIIVYCIGQNEELTSSFTFLFVSTLIADSKLGMEPELETILGT